MRQMRCAGPEHLDHIPQAVGIQSALFQEDHCGQSGSWVGVAKMGARNAWQKEAENLGGLQGSDREHGEEGLQPRERGSEAQQPGT